ncbi:MAG: hypothetical protein JSR59_03925 [Proteobacteria bacterium]|nr:hypothetical protein [Pseudomonadota bacterium]
MSYPSRKAIALLVAASACILHAALGHGAWAQASAPPASSAPGSDADYRRGIEDRAAWEQWMSSLQGDSRKGAAFWAGVRNTKPPATCSSGLGQTSDAYRSSCEAARDFFERRQVDALRRSSPAYLQGWNKYPPGI